MAKKYPNLGRVLKNLLFSRDMKSIDLAREINIPQPTLHRLITGKTTRPYQSSLQPIADYFSITVDQLLGEEPLPGEKLEIKQKTAKTHAKTVPLLSWKNLSQLNDVLSDPEKIKEELLVNNVSDKAFALLMPDSSMEPLFSRGSILIFDMEVKPRDRSYVLILLHEANTYIFRQILIDADHKFLKSLNPELNHFQLRLLNEADHIIACLMESRHNFNYEEGKDLLEEV